MSKKSKLIISFSALALAVACTLFPAKLAIEYLSDSYIDRQAENSHDALVEEKDSIFHKLIKNPISGSFTCVLSYDNTPSFKELSNEEKSDYGMFSNSIDFDNIIYKFNPTFYSEEKTSLGSLCLSIIEYNISKGKDKYAPATNSNFEGWEQSGWLLGRASPSGHDSYSCWLAHPFLIDLSKNENNVRYLNNILNESFNDFTKNEDFDFYNCEDTTNFKYFVKLVSPAFRGSDYWYWETEGAIDRYVTDNFRARQVYGQYWKKNNFKVFLGISNVTHYHLTYDSAFAQNQKNKLLHKSKIGLYLLIFLIEVILCILFFLRLRKVKYNEMTFLEKARKFSNPRNYLKRKYNQEKVDIANKLYNLSLNTDQNDFDAIESLCIEIEEKLGCKFISKNDMKKLRKKCNPKLFMKPYDSLKLSKANELYAKLNTNRISVSDYILFEKEVSNLYK